jgi:hypothetical protein
MTVRRPGKRYILLSSDRPVDPETQREFTRMIFARYPDLGKNRVVWFKGSLIVRTDQLRRPEMEQSLAMRAGGTALVTRRVSGSISKLKRLAEEWSGL